MRLFSWLLVLAVVLQVFVPAGYMFVPSDQNKALSSLKIAPCPKHFQRFLVSQEHAHHVDHPHSKPTLAVNEHCDYNILQLVTLEPLVQDFKTNKRLTTRLFPIVGTINNTLYPAHTYSRAPPVLS